MKLMYDSYETMPASKVTRDGIKTVLGDKDNISLKLMDDVIYATKDGIDLKIRMIYPQSYKNMGDKLPIYCHIQGSAWFKQNLNNHIFDFVDIAREGYIIAIIEYRPSPDFKFPTQVIDAKDAVCYLYDNAEELRIDTNNMYVSGDSSGGHTSLLCWATWNSTQLMSAERKLPEIRAFIDLYGVVDLVSLAYYPSTTDHVSDNNPESLVLGYNPQTYPEKAKEASVLSYIDEMSNNSPLLVMHGNKDVLVPYEQSVELYDQCIKFNKDIVMYCVDEANHGGSMFFTPSTINIILDFIQKHKKSI